MIDAAPLIAQARKLAGRPGRQVLGLVGPPGAGKTTVAAELVAALGDLGPGVVVQVPMDGFHLADAELDRLGRRDRKGSPDTFDADGYAALLRRLRLDTIHTVYAPAFERDIEQPIAGAIAVTAACRLVITEGNYLLLHDDPWPQVRAELDAVWWIDLDDAERRRRLLRRHVEFGKSPEQAEAWIATVDDPNALLIATRGPISRELPHSAGAIASAKSDSSSEMRQIRPVRGPLPPSADGDGEARTT